MIYAWVFIVLVQVVYAQWMEIVSLYSSNVVTNVKNRKNVWMNVLVVQEIVLHKDYGDVLLHIIANIDYFMKEIINQLKHKYVEINNT